MPKRKPNLFLVGAPRCGTTTLYGYLDQHPQIFMPAVKEPHYFCRDLRQECDAFHGREAYFPFRTLEQYLRLFAAVDDQTVVGDASVYYLFSRTAPQEIFDFDCEAKIVVMLREPLSFLRSLHARLRSMGDETRSFGDALKLEESRKSGRDLPRTVRLPSFLYYSDAVRFADHLQRYRAVFGDDRIKVVLLDDFKADSQGVVGDVLDFLGVARRELPEPATLNANREARFQSLTLLLRSLELKSMELSRRSERDQRRLWCAVQRRMVGRIASLVDRVNSRSARRLPLDDSSKQKLRAELRPGVEELSAVLGRDLVALWGLRPA